MSNINIDQLNEKMLLWLTTFESHPQITPQKTHPTISFMLTFVRKTHAILAAIDKEKYQASDAAALAQMTEVMGRNAFAKLMINDTSGKLAVLTLMGEDDDAVAPADFGDDVKKAAEEVCKLEIE